MSGLTGANISKLSAKFPEQEIEWRVQQGGLSMAGNPWVLIIPYITNRAIMQRLDDIVGAGNWKNDFKESPCGKGYLCGISIKIDGEWVTRWDGSELSSSGGSIDPVKSTISSSMKRAGVQWGIGRYLYQFEAMFADCKACENRYSAEDGYTYQFDKKKNYGFQWKAKPLEEWALPITSNIVNKYLNLMSNAKNHIALRDAFVSAYKLASSENDDDLLLKFTEAKDAAKELLIEGDKSALTDEQKRIKSIVDNEISVINSAINSSSVEGLTNFSIEKIRSMLKGNDLKNSISLIKHASNKKLNQLKGQ